MGKYDYTIYSQRHEGRDCIMKEKLDPESRASIVNYRLERAKETLRPRAEAFIDAVEKLTYEE